jgi:cytochrome c556
MKTFFGVAIATLAVCGMTFAQEPAYEAKAAVKDLMAKIVGPGNGTMGAMRKAGGPQSDEDWAGSLTTASLIAEVGQILQRGDRPDTEAWTDGAARLVAGASAVMAASESKNAEAWTAALGEMGQGCRTCHKVHRQQ